MCDTHKHCGLLFLTHVFAPRQKGHLRHPETPGKWDGWYMQTYWLCLMCELIGSLPTGVHILTELFTVRICNMVCMCPILFCLHTFFFFFFCCLNLTDKTVCVCVSQTQCRRLWCTSPEGAQRGCRTQHMPWADGTDCSPGKVRLEWCLEWSPM